jgi:hypothetical protein
MTSSIQSFARLSDDELLATVKRLATTECLVNAALVRSLIELDGRRLYLGEGYSSLFTYCTHALHLAEGAAYNRIEAARAAGSSRHIPASVKRAVWRRDDGRCAYTGRGGRCTERSFLEYHHLQPYAAGGAATAANTELRCRAHNAYEASLFFGLEREPVVEIAATWMATQLRATP